MASNCEDVSAQMMELLYGELPVDARADVDAHVAGCARCRSELESFEKTRAAARAGLHVDEAPPARAHAAIMKAAAAHLAAQAQPAARKAAVPERVSFWDKIRARWALPTLATAAAFGVFLVANRVFLNPERTLDSQRAGDSQETPAVAPATPPATEAVPAPDPAAVAPAETPRPKRPTSDSPLDDLDRILDEKSSHREGPHVKAGKKPAADTPAGAKLGGSAASGRTGDRGDLAKDIAATEGSRSGGGGERRFAPPPPAKPTAAATPRDLPPAQDKFAPPPPPREGPVAKHKEAAKAPVAKKEAPEPMFLPPPSAAPAKRAAPPPTAAKPRAGMDDDVIRKSAEDRSPAVGGAGVVGGAPSPRNKADGYGSGVGAMAAPAAPPAQPSTTSVAGEQRNEMARSRAPAVAAPPPPPPPAPAPVATQAQPKSRAKASADFEAEESAPFPSAETKAEKKQTVGKGGGAIETLTQRADRLFAEGRWSEAAAAYKDLLRRDPYNDDAERWRRRLVAAESADMSDRQQVARKKAAPSRTDGAEAEAQQRGADSKPSPSPPRARKAEKSTDKAAVQGDAAK